MEALSIHSRKVGGGGGGTNLLLKRTRRESPLLALEDMEVIVGSVSTRVTFGPKRRAKDDEVLGDARMKDEHLDGSKKKKKKGRTQKEKESAKKDPTV